MKLVAVISTLTAQANAFHLLPLGSGSNLIRPTSVLKHVPVEHTPIFARLEEDSELEQQDLLRPFGLDFPALYTELDLSKILTAASLAILGSAVVAIFYFADSTTPFLGGTPIDQRQIDKICKAKPEKRYTELCITEKEQKAVDKARKEAVKAGKPAPTIQEVVETEQKKTAEAEAKKAKKDAEAKQKAAAEKAAKEAKAAEEAAKKQKAADEAAAAKAAEKAAQEAAEVARVADLEEKRARAPKVLAEKVRQIEARQKAQDAATAAATAAKK